MDWFWVIALFLALFALGWWFTAAEQKRIDGVREQRDLTAIGLDPKFRGMPVFHGDNASCYVHKPSNSLAVVPQFGAPFIGSIDDVEDVCVVANGATVSKTRKKGVVGRAVVGGVALGGVGAVVGGLTAGSQTVERQIITRIDVHLLLANRQVKKVVFPIAVATSDAGLNMATHSPMADKFSAQLTDTLFA